MPEPGIWRLTLAKATYKLVSTFLSGVSMTAPVSVEQTVQEWGNGLAVRITAPVAKAARFARGLPIKVEVVEGGVFLRSMGKPKLTLAQKLSAFEPAVHGGEAMATVQRAHWHRDWSAHDPCAPQRHQPVCDQIHFAQG